MRYSNNDRICKYVNIRDDEEVMKGVEKMTGLGDSIYQKGVEMGRVKELISLVKDNVLQIAEAAKRLGMSEAEFSKLLNKKQAPKENNN